MAFDFDEWMTLYRRDPTAFEARRREEISRVIDSAPEENRRRLRGLQFQIDMEIRRAKTPLGGCVRLSSLMWDSFMELHDALKRLADDAAGPVTMLAPVAATPAAQVLAFAPRQPKS